MLTLMGKGAPVKPNIPYISTELNQRGFGTWGGPWIASLLAKVAEPALKAVWYQKWMVHRRLRPENMGARIHQHKTGGYIYNPAPDASILNSEALNQIFSNFGTYLLPQAFVEGSPLHPSYGAGHATVAGACTTILKAFFVEDHVLTNMVQPSSNGTVLLPYTATNLTVIGELEKLAYNVAVGRNHAGVHYRTDAIASLMLGQEVAVEILRDMKINYPEPFAGFSFTGFDGINVVI